MKNYITFLLIGLVSICRAQTWSEDFNSVSIPSIPTNWIQVNLDGNTVDYMYNNYYNFGNNAWVSNDSMPVDASHGTYLISTSRYLNQGTSNDWLISPSFTVPANARFKWDATGSGIGDSYYVAISTTGTLTSDFNTTLFSTPAIFFNWVTTDVALSSYAGQTVRIAFVNNSANRLFIRVDNVEMYVSEPNDGHVKDISGLAKYCSGNQIVSGYFKSLGINPANNVTLNYSVNNGSVITQTMNFGTPLNLGDSSLYSFNVPAALSLDLNTIKVWVTQVNGVNEVQTLNDTANTIVYNASQTVLRNALIEEFQSSTCPGSASLDIFYTPIVNANNPNTGSRLSVIKYQTIYSDPSFNMEALNRSFFYKANVLPQVYANGVTHISSYNQVEIDSAKNKPAFADITAGLSMIGSVITATASITPYVSIPVNSPLKIFSALLQKYYNFHSTFTSQNDYHHVMRKMYPDNTGSLFYPTNGVAVTTSFNHTVTINIPVGSQNCFDFWQTTNIEYEYVVFIQDTVTGDVLQSSSFRLLDPSAVGIAELTASNKQMSIYPNPASDFVVIGLKLAKEADITVSIYDQTGKTVYTNKSENTEAGQKELKINTSSLATGIYEISIQTEEGSFKEKLIISK